MHCTHRHARACHALKGAGQKRPGGPDAEAAEFCDVDVEVPPGVPLAEAVGPPVVPVHSEFVGSSGTLTCTPGAPQLGL